MILGEEYCRKIPRGESGILIAGPSRDGATNGWIIGLLSTSDHGVETFDVTGVWHGVTEGDGMSIKVGWTSRCKKG